MINKNRNQLKEAYLVAKANLETLEQKGRVIVQTYIHSNQIKNPENSIPRVSWTIDDNDRCEKAMSDYPNLIEDSSLWGEIEEARKTLQIAEDELLEYGWSIIPHKGKILLKKTVTDNLTIRQIVIGLVMNEDVKTEDQDD